jgi:hypothetical protein
MVTMTEMAERAATYVEAAADAVPDFAAVRRWYEDLGFRPTEPFAG